MQHLLGVILCGGQSKRMGSDKGLLPAGDTIWAVHVVHTLSNFPIPVIYSINAAQYQTYSQYIPLQQLIIDNTSVQGPLRGLLSVHKVYPQHHLLLLACDMLDMDTVTITTIIEAYQNEPGYDFYIYQAAEYAQPFCGIYTTKGLAAVLAKAENNQLSTYSMQHLLNSGSSKRLPVKNNTVFNNYNER